MVYDEQYDEVKQLYELMRGETEGDIKENEFYQYYYNLLENSNQFCKYSSTRLVKEVDESWIEEIEEALPAIQNCIRNPRKFIEEEREIVNIAMARNISTESIRHLLQHSNMIDEYREDGTVIPNRILNVYKEESMNTYENRFICTLLAELQVFINKRYNIINEASKDEIGTNFEVESTIYNYTEVVDYKLSISIKDKQNDVNNELENKTIISRINHLHRQVNMLVQTEFVNTMKRFPSVRHPVVKTNAIQKHPDYKACYKLWDFLRIYTQIGFKVNVVKQDPNISTDFERDIYHSFMWEYAMLHNYSQNSDIMNLNHPKKKKNIGVNYIRQVLEEIVDGVEGTDENIRKLVMNELMEIQRRKNKENADASRVSNVNYTNKGAVTLGGKKKKKRRGGKNAKLEESM